jgi:hypothetical protein
MSRSGYSDDYDDDIWAAVCWRGAVASAMRGRRGQAFLREMLQAMDAMPIKRLVKDELIEPDLIPYSHWGLFETESVCAIGSVGRLRGVDMTGINPEDREMIANTFGIARAMAQEIMWNNDEVGYEETPEHRFFRMRQWIESQIKKDVAA